MNTNKIRYIQRHDISAIKTIIDANQMFPSELLDEMISGFFESQKHSQSISEFSSGKGINGEYWFTFEDDGPQAVAYLSPEAMTEGTWNLLLIAVSPTSQSKGIGAIIMQFLEDALRAADQHLLLVETSGNPEYQRTRQFYLRCGYAQEATIREFYQRGEDKIVFRKFLG